MVVLGRDAADGAETVDTIAKAGLAMGGVAHKPWKLTEVEAFLSGKKPTQENFQQAAELAMRPARTLPDNEYKIEMGKKAIVRALSQAFEKNA